MEDRVGQERRCRAQRRPGSGVGAWRRRARRRRPSTPNAAQTAATWSRGRSSRRRRCPTRVGVDQAQVDARGRARRRRPRRPGRARGPCTVSKNASCTTVDAAGAQARGEQRGVAGATRSAIAPQAVGAVVDGVHRRPSRRAAPARCRCCWSPSPGGCAARGSAARAGRPGRRRRRRETPTSRPGSDALEAVAHRHEAGVRAAEAERHAEALGGADDDVGAQLARAA